MASQYQIDIQMSASTVQALQQGGFQLYGFKAVQTGQSGAAPVVWLTSNQILMSTQIVWQEQYQAYISTSQIIPNGVIVATAAIDIDLGQTASVDANGSLIATQAGTPSTISILNQSSSPWTCGVSQLGNGILNPVCALPLYSNMLDVIAPVEKVLLMFAANNVNTGTVIYQSFASGVLVDVTSTQQRAISFDINNGWAWGGADWATAVPANANLAPILISN